MEWKTLIAIILNGSSLRSEDIVNSFDEILRCCAVIIRSKFEIHFESTERWKKKVSFYFNLLAKPVSYM